MSIELNGKQMTEALKQGDAEVQVLGMAFLGLDSLEAENENFDHERFVFLTSHDDLYFAILDKTQGVALIDAMHPVSGRRINKPKAMESLQHRIVDLAKANAQEVKLIINLDRLGVNLLDIDLFSASMRELISLMPEISRYDILGSGRVYKLIVGGAAAFNRYSIGKNESKLVYSGQGLTGLQKALSPSDSR